MKNFTEKEKQNIYQIKRITIIGAAGNVFLSIIKFVLGIIGNSQAIIADAIHSLSDLTTDFAVILGVKYWTKPADSDHPYGHHRYETIISAAIGFALLIVAIGIAHNALSSMRQGVIRQPSWIAFIGAMISIVLKEILYRWTIKVGRQVKSSAVIANAWHHRSDSLSSIPVAIAIAFAAYNPEWYFLDYVGAFVVSVFILHAAWKIIKSALNEVIDTGASNKEREVLEEIILSTQGVKSTHQIRSRRVGPGWFVDLHIQVDPNLTVHAGHEISREVKNKLLKEGADVLDVIVHLEPEE